MDLNRKTAYEVLLDVEKNQAYSNLSLNNFIEKNQPDSPAFVRELVYGVLENKLLLDHILGQLVASGLKKVKKQDLTLLRMGIYQLRSMNSVPEYAAVNETVKMAKVLARGRDKFINGVLRGYLKKQEEITFPDKESNLVEYLSVVYSAEKWIVKLWLNAYGAEETEAILADSNKAPELTIRTNLLKTTRDKLRELLENEGFEVGETKESPRGLVVKGSGLLATRAYGEGMFSVQDEASMLASEALDVQPGDTVIDVCAAPGGKSFATAELMDGQGTVYSMDIYEHKLKLMEMQAKRTGVSNIQLICHDSTQPREEFAEKADRVLADVPCSGLGVIRRKPEIKYKGNEDLPELVERQERILAAAATYVKPGGTLVYSTCTINPAENQQQVKKFLDKRNDFKMKEERQLLPTMGIDGFYICKMVRE